MIERPTSVTFICLIFFMVGLALLWPALSVLQTFRSLAQLQAFLIQRPVPVASQFFVLGIGIMVSAIYMFHGVNWARMLSIALGAIGFIIGFLFLPFDIAYKFYLLLGLVVYGVIVFFLLSPQATAFFSGVPLNEDF